MMTKKPKVSVIILSYNTKSLLEECLRAVYNSKNIDKEELEVIVVDNNSSDDSCEMVSKKFAQARLIKNKENIGYSAGNNAGIKIATGSYILLLNSDAVVEKDTLKTMLDFMDQNQLLGVSTCRVELPNGELDWACHRGFPTPWNAFTYFAGFERLFPKSRVFSGYHQSWKDLKKPHEVDVISGAFFLIRREIINKVGLLDERFFMYGEDIDLCYRIRQAGYRIMFNPSVKVLHHKKQSGRNKDDEEIRKQSERFFFETMELFYRKHYVHKYPWIVSELVFAALRMRKAKI